MNKPLIFGSIAFLALLILPIIKEFQYLEFLNDPSDLATTFAVLGFVATLLERGTEVYVFLFRSTKRREMEIDLECLDAVEQKAEICEKQKVINRYKSRTAQQATMIALIIGVLVAAAGVRSLEPHFAYPYLEDSQLHYFRIADIIITAGLIAGGTEGIHRAAKVFYGFMDFLKSKTTTS